MKKIYLALDIDGCLSDGKGEIINADHLHQLRTILTSLPVTPFLCTGRSAPYVEAMSQVLGITNWSICENGAYFYNPITDELQYHPSINQATIKVLHDVNDIVRSPQLRKFCKPEIGKEICISLNPINMSIEELYMYVKNLINTDLLYINHSTTAVDITPKGIDKGSALRYLAETRNIDLENLIGIGDSSGDIPFMKLVGFPASPFNASNKVKEVSDYVSTYSSTKGVIDIIQSLAPHASG